MSTTQPATLTPTMPAPIPRPDATLEGLPPEIMTMILQATELRESDWHQEKVVMPILDSTHVFALRLLSRQLASTTTDGFVRRYFSVRKHMLSRRSVQCLLDIAASPKFSSHVRELAFGPERISPELAGYVNGDLMVMGASDEGSLVWEEQKQVQYNWNETNQMKWYALIQDQIAFDSECVTRLKQVLCNLPSLQQVRLDGCPTGEDIWKGTWGARSLVRELGLSEKTDWVEMQFILDDHRYRGHSLPPHFKLVLQALQQIEQQNNWSLNIVFDTSDFEFHDNPEELTTGLWHHFHNRVRSLDFIQVPQILGPDDEDYCLIDFFRSCSNLKKLTLRDTTAMDGMSCFSSVLGVHHLQHLVLLEMDIQNESLAIFLEEHRQTLKEIEFRNVTLKPSDDFNYAPGDTYPTWVTMFEMMLEMPKLRAVQVKGLTQVYVMEDEAHIRVVNRRPFMVRSNDMTAYSGEIATKLGRAVQESFYVRIHYNGLMAELQFAKGL